MKKTLGIGAGEFDFTYEIDGNDIRIDKIEYTEAGVTYDVTKLFSHLTAWAKSDFIDDVEQAMTIANEGYDLSNALDTARKFTTTMLLSPIIYLTKIQELYAHIGYEFAHYIQTCILVENLSMFDIGKLLESEVE